MSNELNYEQAIARLDEIVATLDENEISLDDALKLFEEGTELTALCADKLNKAKIKIETIKKA